MHDIVDLSRHPIDTPYSADWTDFVAESKTKLACDGLVNLSGFLKPGALSTAIREVKPTLDTDAFTHERERIIAVVAFYDRPGVRFTVGEHRGFYGRTA